MAAPGIVNTHAHTTLRATPHRTADMRRDDPTPTMPLVIVWVVDTGIPWAEVKNSAKAAPLSAHIPPTGWRRVIFDPMVLTIRQPPVSVPRAIAVCAASTTHNGTPALSPTRLVAISNARITPMVFWASFAPCPRLYAAAESSWPRRNP